MSLVIAVSVPTGIVLSGDSRTTSIIPQQPSQPPALQETSVDGKESGKPSSAEAVTGEGITELPKAPQPNAIHIPIVLSDATDKLFLLWDKYGVGVYGDAFVSNMPIAHTIQQFELANRKTRPASPQACANALLKYFQALNPLPIVGMMVIGYEKAEQWILGVNVKEGTITRNNAIPDTELIVYTSVWGGDFLVVQRLLSDLQYQPPYSAMNVQDAVDLSRHLIRSTIDQLRFEPRFASVGGPIDTLVVTPAKAEFLIHKSLTYS